MHVKDEKRVPGGGNRKCKVPGKKQASCAGTRGRPVYLQGGTWKRLKTE